MAGKPIHDDEILAAIEKHWLENLYPPSIQYLVDNSGLASKSTMSGALRRLDKKGKIYLMKRTDGYKAYTKWAYWTLFNQARRIEDERKKE
jgi:SOS-response transcriptional repressor LexA